jgi:hypothetical protein
VYSLHALQMCRTCRRYIQRGYSNETEDAKWLVERQTLEDFASAVVSHSSVSIRNILERIHSIVVPQLRTGLRLQGPGIFEQLADVMHVSSLLNTRQAKHRVPCYTVRPVAQLKDGDRRVERSRRVLKIAKSDHQPSHVCPHGTTPLPPHRFS